LVAIVLLVFMAGVGGCLLEVVAADHCEQADGHCDVHCICQTLALPLDDVRPPLHPVGLLWLICRESFPPSGYVGSIFQPPRA